MTILLLITHCFQQEVTSLLGKLGDFLCNAELAKKTTSESQNIIL